MKTFKANKLFSIATVLIFVTITQLNVKASAAAEDQILSDNAAVLLSWLEQNRQDNILILNHYFSKTDQLDQNTIWIDQNIYPDYFNRVVSQYNKNENIAKCNESFNLDFGFSKNNGNKNLKKFMDDMPSVVSESCFALNSTDKILQLINNDQFMMKSDDSIKSSKTDGDITCQKTDVSMVGTSEYCYKRSLLTLGHVNVLYTSLISSQMNQVSAPIFMRESVTIFVEADSFTKMINVTTGRGGDLPAHFLIKPVAQDKNKAYIEKIKAELKN